MKKSLLFLVTVFIVVSTSAQNLKFDSKQSTVSFHFNGENVDGNVSGLTFQVDFNPKEIEKIKVKSSVDVSTLTTGNKMRDKHLKSSDYFDVEVFPKIEFESNSIEVKQNVYYIKGELTIKGITKTVIFKLTPKEGSLIFETKINTIDFGIEVKKKIGDNEVDVIVKLITF
jgi:polyisoprenoid-binding protein YceI